MDFTVDKLARRGRWMVLLCFAGISVAIYLLHTDYNTRADRRKGQTVGFLDEVNGDVRVRAVSSYLWTTASTGTRLYKHDAVQTGNRGKAKIRLETGAVFPLEESTMVILDEQWSRKPREEKKNTVKHWAEQEKKSGPAVRSPFENAHDRQPAATPE